jgi:uncharacterized membrane protein YdjX (TVP38/TMEM64 family)
MRGAGLILLALLVPIAPFVVLGELPGKEWVENAAVGAVGPVGALVLASDVFLPIPSTIVGSYLGYQLGIWMGFLWGWLGLCVGNFIGWAFGRTSLSWLGTHFEAAPSSLLLLATRPLPILAEATLIAVGAAGVPLRKVVLPILLGNAVFAFGLSVSGAALSGPGLSVEWLAIPLGLPLVGLLVARRVQRRSREGSTIESSAVQK